MRITSILPVLANDRLITLCADGLDKACSIDDIPYYLNKGTDFGSPLELYFLLNKTGRIFIALSNGKIEYLTDSAKRLFPEPSLLYINEGEIDKKRKFNESFSTKIEYNGTEFNISCKCLLKSVSSKFKTIVEVLSTPTAHVVAIKKNEDFNKIICDEQSTIQHISPNLVDSLELKLDWGRQVTLSDIGTLEHNSNGDKILGIKNKMFILNETRLFTGNSEKSMYELKYYTGKNDYDSLWLAYKAWDNNYQNYTVACLNISSLKQINMSMGMQYGTACLEELRNLLFHADPEGLVTQHSTGNIYYITSKSGLEVKEMMEGLKNRITLHYTFLYELVSNAELNFDRRLDTYERFIKNIDYVNLRLLWEKSSNKHFTIDIFKNLMFTATPETKHHCTRIQTISLTLAESLSRKYEITSEQKSSLSMGALLHDVGKILVPPSILNKPGKLTDEEFMEIKQHSALGSSLFGNMPVYRDVYKIIRHHHERYDGNGYPDRIPSGELPILVSIVTLVDSVDAILSARCYKTAMPMSYLINELKANSGKQFHPDAVDAFLTCLADGKLEGLINIEYDESTEDTEKGA